MGGNAGLTVLLDDAGFVLTLMKLGSKSTGTYPANFHVGFFLDSEAKVDAIHGRMVADGLDVAAPKREHSYSFYVGAPGGSPGRSRRASLRAVLKESPAVSRRGVL